MKAIVIALFGLAGWRKVTAFVDLVLALDEAPHLKRHRTTALMARLRLVAASFALPTLLWIGFDMMALEPASWMILAAARLAAVACFLILLMLLRSEWSRPAGLVMLAITLALPLGIYVVAELQLGERSLTGMAAVDRNLYHALPYIVLAGLSVFPLLIFESLLLALPVVLVAVIGPALSGQSDVVSMASTLWILLLVLGVYLLSGLIQLHYMTALLGRASYDPLTGVFTRSSGMESIEFHFRVASETGKPLALAFFDIDNFKSINDRYGHDEGDRVLKMAAQAIGNLVRRGDPVVRWGGEEFLILFPDASAEGVEIALKRLFPDWLGLRPDGLPLTASVGVAERMADDLSDWPALVELADQRMYAAKTTGKARCILPGNKLLS